MGKIIEIIKKLFPVLQPEWVFCNEQDIPKDILVIFFEEEVYNKKIGKDKFDINVQGYRYKYSPKKEMFMIRRQI